MSLARCLGIDEAAPAEAGVRLGQPAFHATLPLVAVATDCDTLGAAQHRVILVLFHARAARQARRIVAYDARARPCAALAWLDARTLVLALGADIEVLRLPRDAFEGGVDASSSDWLAECEFETFSFHVSPIRELAVQLAGFVARAERRRRRPGGASGLHARRPERRRGGCAAVRHRRA